MSTDNDPATSASGGAQEKRPAKGSLGPILRRLGPIDLDHFRARILQDALTEATADYWLRRAQTFEDAAPRAGDYRGRATPADLVDQAIRCKQLADNCRRHADLITEAAPEPIDADVWTTVLGEVA